MSKVVGIDSTKRPDTTCQFCGADPAHPYLTCPRIKYAETDENGALVAVEFFEPEVWKPRA